MKNRNGLAEASFIKYVSQNLDGTYGVYNWEYHPVPMPGQPPAWELYPDRVRLWVLTPRVARALSALGSDDITHVTLFDGTCKPWTSTENMTRYVRKLRILSRLLLPY